MNGDVQVVLDSCYLFNKGTNIVYGENAVINN